MKALIAAIILHFSCTSVLAFGSDQVDIDKIRSRDFRELPADDPIFEDIYVQLYKTRVGRIESRQAGLQANFDTLTKRWDRHKKLVETNAVSQEEYETAERDAIVARAQLEVLRADLKEAEAMLNIAIDRVMLGLAMPICPEVRAN